MAPPDATAVRPRSDLTDSSSRGNTGGARRRGGGARSGGSSASSTARASAGPKVPRTFWQKLTWSAPWIGLGLVVAQTVGFVRVLQREEVVGSAWFIFGVLIALVPVAIFLRLQYRQRVLGHRINYSRWEQELPKEITTATLTGIVSGLCFVMAFWPMWGFLTPLILFAIFIGFLSVCELF